MKQRRICLCSVIALCLFGLPALADEGNISATDKYAWSENAGWLNFRPTHGGVTVYPDHLEGYAWAENIGWVRLGAYTSGGTHAYANTSATDYGVNNANGVLSGYAWGENVGWINFQPTHGGVTIALATGEFSGYAWSENIGWIKVSGAAQDATTYRVKMAPATYTLTYTAGANGSISGTTPQTVNHGASGTAVTAVPNTGYRFVKWSDNSTANPRTDTNVTAAISVTALFEATPPFGNSYLLWTK
ncbi:secreted protein [Candidatus Vecturithrix granuli]|uniref:Secreted protein n=1 Tax=Vecturithrix granuli TaxID=1499967 RepID=A0A0S6W6X4_VECG1|nr:secreted protein [Candidatus Vecturithrix granuli]